MFKIIFPGTNHQTDKGNMWPQRWTESPRRGVAGNANAFLIYEAM